MKKRIKPTTKEQRVFNYRRMARSHKPKIITEVTKLARQKYGNISSDEMIEFNKPEPINPKQ